MKVLILASVLVLLLSSFCIPTIASSNTSIPLVRSIQGPSLNWSGYAVSTQNVTSVSGTFVVPSVSAPGRVNGLSTDVSAWVGIDGYTSGTVEQVGVSGSYNSATNTAIYNAWWEMYPRVSTTIHSMTVSAGDSMTASVNYLGSGSFQLSITDTTTGQSFSTTAKAPVGGPNAAQRNSAEWIVERAATIYKGYLTILPLATFSTVTFTEESFAANGATLTLQYAVDNYAQYSGYPATPPSQPYWENMFIVGITSSNTLYPLDSTSIVTSNSFTVSFIANGTPISVSRI